MSENLLLIRLEFSMVHLSELSTTHYSEPLTVHDDDDTTRYNTIDMIMTDIESNGANTRYRCRNSAENVKIHTIGDELRVHLCYV